MKKEYAGTGWKSVGAFTQSPNHLITQLLTLFAASALVALVLMALPMPRANAQTGGQGKIEGQIVNGTKDAALSAGEGLTVTLYSAAMGMTSPISTTTQSDASGKFTFSNLETISTTRYLLATSYRSVDYYSDVLTFDVNQTTLPVTLMVYETTTDPAALRVPQMHLVFDLGAGRLNVLQLIAVQNNTDRAYVGATGFGPHRATLALPLLAGATNVQFDNPSADSTTLRGDDVLTYTLPFVPGNNQIVYSYMVPFKPPTFQFSLKLAFNADKVRVLLPDVGATIQSAQLSAPVPFPTQSSRRYLMSTAENVTAGMTLNATLTNLPDQVGATDTRTFGDNSPLVGGIVLGIAGIAAIALLIYPMLKRRQARARRTPADNRRLELLQAIADLDDAFEAQTISEAEYKAQRAALKAKLLELPE